MYSRETSTYVPTRGTLSALESEYYYYHDTAAIISDRVFFGSRSCVMYVMLFIEINFSNESKMAGFVSRERK